MSKIADNIRIRQNWGEKYEFETLPSEENDGDPAEGEPFFDTADFHKYKPVTTRKPRGFAGETLIGIDWADAESRVLAHHEDRGSVTGRITHTVMHDQVDAIASNHHKRMMGRALNNRARQVSAINEVRHILKRCATMEPTHVRLSVVDFNLITSLLDRLSDHMSPPRSIPVNLKYNTFKTGDWNRGNPCAEIESKTEQETEDDDR